jgi:hypothetical protein
LTSFKNALKLSEDESGSGDVIEKLFGIELVNTVKNKETEDEAV